MGDPFDYETWDGHYELVKLDLAQPAVRQHLLAAVDHWIDAFGIDGLPTCRRPACPSPCACARTATPPA